MINFGRAPCDEGVIRGATETAGCAERARPWVLATTILGSGMAFIDGSVVNVALPAIQADLATTVGGAQWVVALSWRTIFFINVPIALLTLGLAFWHVPESRDTSDDAAIDWLGGTLATLGLAGLAYGLTLASASGWATPSVLGGTIGGVLVLVLFVRHEARAAS